MSKVVKIILSAAKNSGDNLVQKKGTRFKSKTEYLVFEKLNTIGKNNIKATRSDLIEAIGEDGMKDIIRKVLLGGNVRDVTEFITQKRLLYSYASILDLFVSYLDEKIETIEEYSSFVSEDLKHRRRKEEKILDLWLLGLTGKGLDNIVREEEKINNYKDGFSISTSETISDIEKLFGELDGEIKLNGKRIPMDWKTFSLLSIALGAQTLTIRGSAKSMNGKLFEKLILGCLLTIMDFSFCPEPPNSKDAVKKNDRLFWLSNMDENERETDATLIYDGKAMSIDIGFIGKGNPEITLDKASRFNRYKQIAGIGHEMKTVIIVDTVAENSDLIHKAAQVEAVVLQMSQKDWIIDFAKVVCDVFSFEHPLKTIREDELNDYILSRLEKIDIKNFLV